VKAIVIPRFGGPEVLELREVEPPRPGRGEVRVRVRATAVNRADLLQRMGAYPAPPDAPADIPGLEYAGEVEALGEGVTESEAKPGDRVFGLCGGGAYAEALVTHVRALARIPDTMSFRDAAAVPEAFITAWDAMVTQAGLSAGETVLVHAAGSGVGTAALQLARALGARSVATSRTAAKLESARALGADHVVVAEGGKFAAGVRETAGEVDVVLELVGGGYLAEDLLCLSPRGRIVLVGLLAGARSELDLSLLLRKRLHLMGTVLRARPLEEKIAAMRAFVRHVVPLLQRGTCGPVVGRTWPLAEAAQAHTYVASNQGFGKVVLEV